MDIITRNLDLVYFTFGFFYVLLSVFFLILRSKSPEQYSVKTFALLFFLFGIDSWMKTLLILFDKSPVPIHISAFCLFISALIVMEITSKVFLSKLSRIVKITIFISFTALYFFCNVYGMPINVLYYLVRFITFLFLLVFALLTLIKLKYVGFNKTVFTQSFISSCSVLLICISSIVIILRLDLIS